MLSDVLVLLDSTDVPEVSDGEVAVRTIGMLSGVVVLLESRDVPDDSVTTLFGILDSTDVRITEDDSLDTLFCDFCFLFWYACAVSIFLRSFFHFRIIYFLEIPISIHSSIHLKYLA